MKNFKNILVIVNGNVDLSNDSAIYRGAALAAPSNGRLTLMDIIDAPENIAREYKGIISAAELIDMLVKKRCQELQVAAAALMQKNIDVIIKVLSGRIFIETIRQILQGKHDLLIKVANDHKGSFDSDDFHLMRKCPQPVWLLKSNQGLACQRVLAAIDLNLEDNEEGKALNTLIMDLATSLAHWQNSDLHILSCWSLYGENALRDSTFLNVSEEKVLEALLEEEQYNQTYLDNLIARYSDSQCEKHLMKGVAKECIPDFVRQNNIGVVIMGTVARTGIPGLLIGNTAEIILQLIDSSLITVKPAGFISPIK
ncbi:MAG: nucleotide-binding universal stress UspA family protein [Porticoccus sp.]|jgi:nucleotide-binding universal stress UspA family protein